MGPMKNNNTSPDWFARGQQADAEITSTGEAMATYERLEQDGLGKSRTIRRDRSLFLRTSAWLDAYPQLPPLEQWSISAEAMTTLANLADHMNDRDFVELASKAVTGSIKRAELKNKWSRVRQAAATGDTVISTGRPAKDGSTRPTSKLNIGSIAESVLAVELPDIIGSFGTSQTSFAPNYSGTTPDLIMTRIQDGKVYIDAVEIRSKRISHGLFNYNGYPLPLARKWLAVIGSEIPALPEQEQHIGIILCDIENRKFEIVRQAKLDKSQAVPEPWASLVMSLVVT